MIVVNEVSICYVFIRVGEGDVYLDNFVFDIVVVVLGNNVMGVLVFVFVVLF